MRFAISVSLPERGNADWADRADFRGSEEEWQNDSLELEVLPKLTTPRRLLA
jgi:hypothetical protein